MEEQKDVVIGFITDYDFDKLRPWVFSLLESGFSGDKIVVCYNIKKEVAEKLHSLGFDVVGFEQDVENNIVFNQEFNVVVSRFFHLWLLLKDKKYRYVISTDVADVVFQKNPSTFLEENLKDKNLCVGSENLTYIDEAWGINNMYKSFGEVAAYTMANKTIYNAGTIAGTHQQFVDFCYNVYLVSKGAPLYVEGGGGPDQAAMNLLLSLEPYKSMALFNNHDDVWACQCGTTLDPNKYDTFKPKFLTKNEPTYNLESGFVSSSKTSELYTLVHQYNRVPELNEIIRKKYERYNYI